MGILFSHEKEENPSFATTWMDLESVIANWNKSEREREREILYGLIYMWILKTWDSENGGY